MNNGDMKENENTMPALKTVAKYIFGVAAAALGASIVGTLPASLLPCPDGLNPAGWKMLLGALLLMTLHLAAKLVAKCMIQAHIQRLRKTLLDQRKIPAGAEDMKRRGVTNPVEYCFVALAYARANTIIGGKVYPPLFDDTKSFCMWRDGFEDMFGRKPFRCESYDWFECLKAELGKIEQKDYSGCEITEDVLRMHVNAALISGFAGLDIYVDRAKVH